MAYEHEAGRGTAFKNERYENGGSHPYAKGTVKTPSGELLEIALWIPKTDKVKGFNVTLQEPYDNSGGTEESAGVDDLPF